MFAKLGHSPSKYGKGPTPRRNQMNTPVTARRPPQNRSPSPTPRGHRYGTSRDDGNTTNLILDFTDQISGFSGRLNQSPAKLARQSPYNNSSVTDMVCNSPHYPNHRLFSITESKSFIGLGIFCNSCVESNVKSP
jgi:hypothetical protein